MTSGSASPFPRFPWYDLHGATCRFPLVRPAFCVAPFQSRCRVASSMKITLHKCTPRYLAKQANCQGGTFTHKKGGLRGTPSRLSVFTLSLEATSIEPG